MKENSNSNVVDALKQATGDLLNEEALQAIEQSFNESVDAKVEELVSLQVEKALVEQDEDHAAKLESLLEAIDTDHTNKLNRVVKAINENHAEKLKNIVKKYSGDVVEEASSFKNDLVDRISNYLELYIENTIPTEDIKQAVENKNAQQQLAEMRKFLAVNDALSKESIKTAIIDGKRQIQESKQSSQALLEENDGLKTQLLDLKRSKLLEEKTSGLPTVKKKYITRVLGNKPLDFIEENFEYTLKLFEKSEEDKIQQAKQQAERSSTQVDRPKTIVNESKQTEQSVSEQQTASGTFDYMSELSKF
jgi:hypothetical protein